MCTAADFYKGATNTCKQTLDGRKKKRAMPVEILNKKGRDIKPRPQ
jgi:hypothetical protein